MLARVLRADRGAADVLVTPLVGAPADAPRDPAAGVTAEQAAPSPPDAVEAGPAPRRVRVRWDPALTRRVAGAPSAAPVAGDWVVLSTGDPAPDAGTLLREVLPRRTVLARAQVARGSSQDQVLAANVDVVAVVEGMHPDLDLGRLERLLALAWASGAEPLVVLTKADLVAVPDDLVADAAAIAPGVEVLAVSSTTGAGLRPLHARLAAGATLALVGASGVGKSSLVNALTGSDRAATSVLRRDGKGRHTTVARELHLLASGGGVLDTPGLRSVGLSGSEPLDEVFADIEDLATGCRYRDCSHEHEPGCAVLAAVDAGTLPERRLTSHRRLQRELAYRAARVDARLRAQREGRWKAVHREVRRRGHRP
ncbi:ribosome small subunit-dependent GTPase A [Thalassiella azotivora]